MKKRIISLKKYLKLFAVLILTITIIFLLLNQFVIRYRINDFIDINADEIIELNIIEQDIDVITEENTYATKEFNIKNDEKIEMFINRLNEIVLKRDFENEMLYKLGQWVTYPETTSSLYYRIYIKTHKNTIKIKLASGNTYIALNVMEIKKHIDKKHYIDEKQYYFKIEDGCDEKFLIEILE